MRFTSITVEQYWCVKAVTLSTAICVYTCDRHITRSDDTRAAAVILWQLCSSVGIHNAVVLSRSAHWCVVALRAVRNRSSD
jgi:hypothetical protein